MKELINLLNKYNQKFEIVGDNIVADTIYLYNNNLTSLPDTIGNLKCNTICLSHNKLTSLPEHKSFENLEITDEYIYCDGILTWYKSKKKIGKYTLYVGYFDECVASLNDEVFSHGESLRQCITDINFKLSDRDTRKYKGLDISSKHSIDDLVIMYRTITGACSGGCEKFLNSIHDLKKEYSIREVIEMTKGWYNNEVFKSFFCVSE